MLLGVCYFSACAKLTVWPLGCQNTDKGAAQLLSFYVCVCVSLELYVCVVYTLQIHAIVLTALVKSLGQFPGGRRFAKGPAPQTTFFGWCRVSWQATRLFGSSPHMAMCDLFLA